MSLNKELLAKGKLAGLEFCDYLAASVSPFHCVQKSAAMLDKAGFTRLHETDAWPLAQNGRYYVTRNGSSLIAFTVGGAFAASNGATIVGAHTDSPNLHLKPKSAFTRQGYQGVGVQLYGGGLWHTWFDRELSVAGKVVFRKKDSKTELFTKLVHVQRPLLQIPNLAIHLTSADDRGKFAPHKENHIAPMISTTVMAALYGEDKTEEADKHCPALTRVLMETAGEDPAQTTIVDFDLCLVDAHPPALGGVYDEFVFSGRLDNQVSCYCALKALIDTVGSVKDDRMVRMAVLFDHEEVGSASTTGAEGSLVPDVIDRLMGSFTSDGNPVPRPVFVAKSFCVSADGAHAVHMNYGDKHHPQHAPHLHLGPVLKLNANARYATNAATAAVMRLLAEMVDVPLQDFCVKNDSPCGSTIGPILSTLTGIPTVDLGNAMLSMHSVRETCGTVDLVYLTMLLGSFYENFQKITLTEK
eukprot:PhM_4_TR6106/c0_g1_i1/m.8388/K01267/DNPEP; aspartyl aminopeptidase